MSSTDALVDIVDANTNDSNGMHIRDHRQVRRISSEDLLLVFSDEFLISTAVFAHKIMDRKLWRLHAEKSIRLSEIGARACA